MDTDGHRSVVIVTFGEIAEDARRLANQIERWKSFRISAQHDLAKRLNTHLPQKVTAHLEQLDAADVAISHVIGAQKWFVLIQDRLRASWFYLLDSDGNTVEAANETITMLRRQRPELALVRYGRDAGDSCLPSPTPFDRASYLAKCKQEFQTLKYDALATLGIKLPNASVAQVYVPASADVGEATSSSTAYRQAINDILDSLNLDEAQRSQLESQLREGIPTFGMKESGAARSLYQQYGNVLVLGDPGSGKTCFLKNEILSYCDGDDKGWYQFHVPVFVPLAEAAAVESDDLLEICSELLARRGLPLARAQLAGC